MTHSEEHQLMQRLHDFIEANHDEYLRFDHISPERKLHRRMDVNAFLLLDKLVTTEPPHADMVASVGIDEIYLRPSPAELMLVASEEDLLDLMRSGVRYDSQFNCLSMFV